MNWKDRVAPYVFVLIGLGCAIGGAWSAFHP